MLTKETVTSILGKGFADKLDEPILRIGDQLTYSRRSMIDELGCANFIAAARLDRVLRRLGITTISKLAKTDPHSIARVRSVGASTLFVAMCVLDSHNHDVEKWWGWKQEADNVVKFSTFKAKAVLRAKKRSHVA